MALMSYELYDALRSAQVDEEKARKAAEAVAAFENRFAELRTDIAAIKSSLLSLQVFLGVNVTLSLLILGKLFVFTGKT
jgi:hypothetical protein